MAIITTDKKLTCTDLEVAVAIGFNYRMNLIVPNISWGLNFKHEIDVLVLTPSNYAYEIEIKISASDLRRDFLKSHGHASNRLRRQYFCVTSKLEELALELITTRSPTWGLLVVPASRMMRIVRQAQPNKMARPFTDAERQHLYDLASMRTWTLKEIIANQKRANLTGDHS